MQSFFSIFLALVSVCLVHIPYLLSKLPCYLISFSAEHKGCASVSVSAVIRGFGDWKEEGVLVIGLC